MLVGDRDATAAEFALAHQRLDVQELLLRDDHIRESFRALALADTPARRIQAEQLSAYLEQMPTDDVERLALALTDDPAAAPLLICSASTPDEPVRVRARTRTPATLVRIADALARRAEGRPAGAGVSRLRLREATRWLDDEPREPLALAATVHALKSSVCECPTSMPGDDGTCAKCGKAVKRSRSWTRTVLTAKQQATLRTAGWTQERIESKDFKLAREAFSAELLNRRGIDTGLN